MSDGFDAPDLALLRSEEEVEIETSGGAGEPVHRTIIWLVVDDRDRVLARSYRGPGARWYREVIANPDCWIHVAGRRIATRAVVAADAERVDACTEWLRVKYAGQPSMPVMLRQYLETTLELVPR